MWRNSADPKHCWHWAHTGTVSCSNFKQPELLKSRPMWPALLSLAEHLTWDHSLVKILEGRIERRAEKGGREEGRKEERNKRERGREERKEERGGGQNEGEREGERK